MNDLNKLKNRKLIDFVGQLFCVIIPVLVALATQKSYAMFSAYFAVGAWQVVSCIGALVKGKTAYRSSTRGLYNVLLLIVAIIYFLSMLEKEAIIIALMGLLFFSPFMALLYMIITYTEYDNIVKLIKEEDHDQYSSY